MRIGALLPIIDDILSSFIVTTPSLHDKLGSNPLIMKQKKSVS